MFITDPTFSFRRLFASFLSHIPPPPPQRRSRMIFLRRFPRHSLLRWTVTVLRAGGRWCTSCTSPSLPVLRSSVLVPPVFLVCFTSRPSPVVNKHLSVRHRRSFATCYCQASLAVFALLIRRIRQLVFSHYLTLSTPHHAITSSVDVHRPVPPFMLLSYFCLREAHRRASQPGA